MDFKARTYHPFLCTIVALATVLLLIGRFSRHRKEQERAQVLANQQEEAIRSVASQIDIAVHKINKDQESAHDQKAAYELTYEAFLRIDVSACPRDFREQYRQVVTSRRQLLDAFNDVPTGILDSVLYWWSQLKEPSPDLRSKAPIENLEVKRQQPQEATTELRTISRRYGVTASFGFSEPIAH